MNKELIYEAPDLEIVLIELDNVCSDVIHASFEHGGTNSGWGFGGDDDDDDNWDDGMKGGDLIW